MSLVRCSTTNCHNYVREGLRRTRHDPRFSAVKELADGRRCWRCRDGRRGHLETRQPDLPGIAAAIRGVYGRTEEQEQATKKMLDDAGIETGVLLKKRRRRP